MTAHKQSWAGDSSWRQARQEGAPRDARVGPYCPHAGESETDLQPFLLAANNELGGKKAKHFNPECRIFNGSAGLGTLQQIRRRKIKLIIPERCKLTLSERSRNVSDPG